MLYNMKKISEFEFNVYQTLYKKLQKAEVSARVVLKCGADVAFERCALRNREGEKVTLDYIEKMDDMIDDFFVIGRNIPTIVINTKDVDIHDIADKTSLFLEEQVQEANKKRFKHFFLPFATFLVGIWVLTFYAA